MSSPDRRNFESRKLTPESRQNNGVVHNLSDAPLIQRGALGQLAVFIPKSHSSGIPNGHFVLKEETVEADYSRSRGFRVVPMIEEPITQVFSTSYGGGRVGGGGCSPEAIRRARRKARSFRH